MARPGALSYRHAGHVHAQAARRSLVADGFQPRTLLLRRVVVPQPAPSLTSSTFGFSKPYAAYCSTSDESQLCAGLPSTTAAVAAVASATAAAPSPWPLPDRFSVLKNIGIHLANPGCFSAVS